MADIKLKLLEDQLKRIGCNFRFWGRPELRELAYILFPDEIVEHCVNGSYEGGIALLVATDQRVLLVDKKPFYLTLEDIRFDMITEIDYSHRLLNATVSINTPNKSLRFLGYNHDRLRKLFSYSQMKVMEIRQHYQHQGQVWKDYAASLQTGQQFQSSPQPQALPATQQFQAYAFPDMQFQAMPATQPAMPPLPYHTVAPVVSAYTRLPMRSRQRRFLGSKALRRPLAAQMTHGRQ